ncbi:C10 family peptidase [Flavobacterium dauae]|uniref:C10 family peptidase n=1 Tax=Flavobacterium dauae TaxID=1563479 RepID=UPI00101B21FC|nr:C10 family peptidase [Flavobacterium dauae]WLD23277.1 C10 family peptidase [Flavobacterium dauae]
MNRKPFYLLIGLIALFFSCTQQEFESDLPEPQNKIFNVHDENFVNIDEIENIANNIFTDSPFFKGRVSEVMPIGSVENKPSYYIINYTEGFLIMSADKRALPVLAFSDKHNFRTDAEVYPSGLVDWLEFQDNYIQLIRKDSITDIISVSKTEWTIGNIEKYIRPIEIPQEDPPVPSRNCKRDGAYTEFLYGPLLNTTWGQGVGYNNLAPHYGCSNYSNGNTPTGCVATAMAQVMRYYQHPSSYNWTLMNNGTGSAETSRLMRDAGDSVNMNWGCDGSGAKTQNVPNALKSTFSYSSADLLNSFNVTIAKDEISNDYPIILSGGERKTKWLFFNVYENGHAWVCDGIRQDVVPVRTPVGQHGYETNCKRVWLKHMNWGWNGSYNGWYNFWHVAGYRFDYKPKMVYNIRN